LVALRKLKDGHYLHLPVVEDGTTVGLVDVMTLTISMLTYLVTCKCLFSCATACADHGSCQTTHQHAA
jgi:hypothetical protein